MDSEMIEQQVADFLANGGKIKVIPFGETAIEEPKIKTQREVRESLKRSRRHQTIAPNNQNEDIDL